MTAKLSNSAKQIDKLNNHIKNQQQTITSKQTQIEQKQAQINNRNKELLLLSDKIKQTQFVHEKQLDDLASQLAQKEHLLEDKQNKVSETQNELDKMNEQSRN